MALPPETRERVAVLTVGDHGWPQQYPHVLEMCKYNDGFPLMCLSFLPLFPSRCISFGGMQRISSSLSKHWKGKTHTWVTALHVAFGVRLEQTKFIKASRSGYKYIKLSAPSQQAKLSFVAREEAPAFGLFLGTALERGGGGVELSLHSTILDTSPL